MKLRTDLHGPLFDGLKVSMFLTLENDGPLVTFVFDLGDDTWAGLTLKNQDRGHLLGYRISNVIDRKQNVNLAEAIAIVKGGLYQSGKFKETYAVGETQHIKEESK